MAEFEKVMKDAARMYEKLDDENHPIYIGEINFEEFEKIVEQWAEEHPAKTNRMVIEKMFPNAEVERLCMRALTGQKPENGCAFSSASDCVECAKKWIDLEYKGGAEK